MKEAEKLMLLNTVLKEFFDSVVPISQKGGFWVSYGGGTQNVIIGQIRRRLDLRYKPVWEALQWHGRAWALDTFDNVKPAKWYKALVEVQGSKPYPWTVDQVLGDIFEELKIPPCEDK